MTYSPFIHLEIIAAYEELDIIVFRSVTGYWSYKFWCFSYEIGEIAVNTDDKKNFNKYSETRRIFMKYVDF